MRNLLLKYLPSDPRRRRWVVGGAILFLLLVWLVLPGGETDSGAVATARVERGPLTISLSESGTIRPRQQVVLSNEMDDPAAIVFIVPEGTVVQKGELLVELDATEAEAELVERRIRVQNAEAEVIYARENLSVVKNQGEADIEQAELDLEFSKQDLEKYLKGEYPMELMTLESDIKLAEEELKQSNEQLRWSRILAEEKYLSEADLEKDELAAQKVELSLTLARRSLEVFETYTHVRQLTEFESMVKQAGMALERAKRKATANVAQAEAELRASEAEIEEDRARLRRVEQEVARAKMYAPIDGMVLYASSVSNRWDNDDDQIEEGAMVDERGEIIYLPTASSYDVDIQIAEANLGKVLVGQRVRLEVDALPGEIFSGRIAKVARLPDSRSRWMNPNLKLYNTVIEMDPFEASLRNGMSCRAEIMVEQHEDALFAPIQCVAQLGGEPVVHVVRGGRSRAVPVEIGLDNNRVVHLLSGVEAGDEILLQPPFDDRPPSAEDRWEAESGPTAEPGETQVASRGATKGA